jgi:hypothetical protein
MKERTSFSNQFAITYSIVMGGGSFWKDGDGGEWFVQFQVCDQTTGACVFSYDADFASMAESTMQTLKLNGKEHGTAPRRIDIPVEAFCGATLYYTNTINMPNGTMFIFVDPKDRKAFVKDLRRKPHSVPLKTERDLRTEHALSVRILRLMSELATIAEDNRFKGDLLEGITCSMTRGEEELHIDYRVMKRLEDGKPVKKAK